MSADRGTPGTDPTLTPDQAIGIAETSASNGPGPVRPSQGRMPARYKLGAQLGAGGMGEVLLAADGQIERDVAIKRMRIEPNDDAIARFVREAKIQGRLDHPAIVPVHELGIDGDGRPFFVMKRLTGTTLADLLTSASPPPRAKLLRAFADVCLAIEFAHSRGVLHRDLKPANIMLGDFGEVYVLDWGVARIMAEAEPAVTGGMPSGSGETTEVGAILGTPGYIAPEMLRGATLDPRADVYALGCILFELLAGEPLLPRGRAALSVDLDAIDARPSVRAPDRDIPPELDAICVAATAFDRERRPSARQLGEQVERYLDGDRDVALRKQLAADHLTAARAALVGGDGEAERVIAMREAGRALALDPRIPGAAEVVGRLMLEPPKVVPHEVEDRVRVIEEETAHNKVKLMVKVLFALLAYIPLVLLMGLRSNALFAAMIAAIVINIGYTAYVARRGVCRLNQLYAAAVLFAVLVGLLGHSFSTFLFAPAVAGVSVMMFTVDPRVRWSIVAVIHVIGVLVPWALELAGVVSPTLIIEGGDFVMRSPMVAAVRPYAEVGLGLYAITLIALSAFSTGRLAAKHREVVRSVELQSWHLRRLVES